MPQQPPPQSSSYSTSMNNVNQALQMGLTLQQIFQNEQQRGAAARAQAIAGMQNRGAAPQYQPSALDPRLQQIMMSGRR